MVRILPSYSQACQAVIALMFNVGFGPLVHQNIYPFFRLYYFILSETSLGNEKRTMMRTSSYCYCCCFVMVIVIFVITINVIVIAVISIITILSIVVVSLLL